MTNEATESDGNKCRVVDVDGEPIRVQGVGEMDEESREALAVVIRAVRSQMDAGQ